MSKSVKLILSKEAEKIYNYLVEKSENSKFDNQILKAFMKKKRFDKN